MSGPVWEYDLAMSRWSTYLARHDPRMLTPS